MKNKPIVSIVRTDTCLEGKTQLSQAQLQLQLRIAQRRIEKINAILESGVQASADHTVDSDTTEVISRLYDTSLSDADISSCINILEMLLEIGGLIPLLNVMKSESYSMAIRKQAAKAITSIGGDHIEKELKTLRGSASPPELNRLVDIALGLKNI